MSHDNLLNEDFKNNLKEYLDIDNQIKEANKSLKIIRQRKSSLSHILHTRMKEFSIDILTLPGELGTIKAYTSTITAPLNKVVILQRCILLCQGDENKAKQMCDFICDPEAREKKQKEALRKTSKRKK